MNLIQSFQAMSEQLGRKMVIFRYSAQAWELITTIATGKPRTIQSKTEKAGVLSGFVNLSKVDVPLVDGLGSVCHGKGPVLTHNGYPVTSDLDIFWIERHQEEQVVEDLQLGYLTPLEKQIIHTLNAAFKTFCKRDATLITHGPYVHHRNPKKKDIVFPYDAFHPVSGHSVIHHMDGLKLFSDQLAVVDTWP